MPFQQAVEALQGEVDRLKLELQSLQAHHGVGEITIGNYILTRLTQLGVTVGADFLSEPLSTESTRRKCSACLGTLTWASW